METTAEILLTLYAISDFVGHDEWDLTYRVMSFRFGVYDRRNDIFYFVEDCAPHTPVDLMIKKFIEEGIPSYGKS